MPQTPQPSDASAYRRAVADLLPPRGSPSVARAGLAAMRAVLAGSPPDVVLGEHGRPVALAPLGRALRSGRVARALSRSFAARVTMGAIVVRADLDLSPGSVR